MRGILPSGRFWDLDDSGYIVNDAARRKIHPRYGRLLDELVQLYKSCLAKPPIGVYLRGTVARGTDFPGLSDLDDFALVKDHVGLAIPYGERKKLLRDHPEVSGIGLEVDSVHYLGDGTRFSELAFLMTTQTLCLAGKDIIPTLHRYRPGVLVANSDISQIVGDIGAAVRALDDAPNDIPYWCRRICKNIVRCGFSLTMLDHPRFTRDLYPCYTAFSEKYPTREKDLRRTVEFALSPTRDPDVLAAHLHSLGGWMCEEAESWLSRYNPANEIEPLLADFAGEVKFRRV